MLELDALIDWFGSYADDSVAVNIPLFKVSEALLGRENTILVL